MPLHCRHLLSLVLALGVAIATFCGRTQAADFEALQREYATTIQPLLKRFCWDCHSEDAPEGDLDLQRFSDVRQIRAESTVMLKVIEMLDIGEMPPREAPQLSGIERTDLRRWLDDFLDAEAAATAGDPGPVTLRRLNNIEYTNTIQELTDQPLEPAREFPADSAAGEGFTNTGSSLVMSPALLSKYMAAAKSVSEHAILLPDGFRFSPHTTRRDWTDDVLARLREFYGRTTDASGGTRVKLQGLEWETNSGGRLPVDRYLEALVAARPALLAGETSVQQVAAASQLNSKYMAILWNALTAPNQSALLESVQRKFMTAEPETVPQLVDEIAAWQKALTRFQSVGHMKPWLAPIEPFVDQQVLRLPLEPADTDEPLIVGLAAGDAGDGNDFNFVQWKQPRLVAAGRTDIFVCDAAAVSKALNERRSQLYETSAACLAAADRYLASDSAVDLTNLAEGFGVDRQLLSVWFDYLAIKADGRVELGELFTEQLRGGGGFDFVNGWGSAATPSIHASSGDKQVRIPGNMKPHGVVVHPSPKLNVLVSWRSPLSGNVRIEGSVTHAHPECGNGVAWSVEVRHRSSRERLAAGIAQGGKPVAIPIFESVRVQMGELISLVVGPRDENHACDLTDIELKISEERIAEGGRQWNLTADVSPNILAGNPHADSYGNGDTWSFHAEPIAAGDGQRAVIPAGSLLKQWLAAEETAVRKILARKLRELLLQPCTSTPGPDRELWQQTHDVNGPLLGPLLDALASQARDSNLPAGSTPILERDEHFGEPIAGGSEVDATSVAVRAPSLVKLRLPSELCRGRALVVSGTLDPSAADQGCVQLHISAASDGKVSSPVEQLTPVVPFVARSGGAARQRFAKAAEDFRQVFPAALCYTKIVPVDEVVTLALFHREDDHLQRLMLSPKEIVELDAMWDELHFVSRDLLTVEDAYEQLMQFATQDSDPKLFAHLREPIQQRASAFRAALLAAEPHHLTAACDFASQAFRRPLGASEAEALRALYKRLRDEGLEHDAAIRLVLVRILMSPSFLYRLEDSHPGSASSPVTDWELASRLSYFLWSGPPDEGLRSAAAAGKLGDADGAAAAAKRMLTDPRVRHLAREFACQWLQIQDVGELNEKSERHFPEFAEVRGDLQKEAELFFTDLFQHDRSILNIFDADYTFVNGRLAKHYALSEIAGDGWQRVSGVRASGRGGALTFGATLAKQSGASRTSPILRGIWVSEVLLGERLPKPPKDVPVLPDDASSTDLTVRQLVERHTRDERCANCHQRIDAFGFAMERYDAIGRLRTIDHTGQPLDTRVTLPDGTSVADAVELRDYLTNQKRDVLVKQFCRKLLGYALGRSVRLSDQQLVSQMQQALEANDYRFSVAVEHIVRSRQFLHIRDRDRNDDQVIDPVID